MATVEVRSRSLRCPLPADRVDEPVRRALIRRPSVASPVAAGRAQAARYPQPRLRRLHADTSWRRRMTITQTSRSARRGKEAVEHPAQEARAKADAGSGWYAWLARGGLVAKGVSFGIVGILAVGVAAKWRRQGDESSGCAASTRAAHVGNGSARAACDRFRRLCNLAVRAGVRR